MGKSSPGRRPESGARRVCRQDLCVSSTVGAISDLTPDIGNLRPWSPLSGRFVLHAYPGLKPRAKVFSRFAAKPTNAVSPGPSTNHVTGFDRGLARLLTTANNSDASTGFGNDSESPPASLPYDLPGARTQLKPQLRRHFSGDHRVSESAALRSIRPLRFRPRRRARSYLLQPIGWPKSILR